MEKLECTVAMQEKDFFKATIAQQQKQIEPEASATARSGLDEIRAEQFEGL